MHGLIIPGLLCSVAGELRRRRSAERSEDRSSFGVRHRSIAVLCEYGADATSALLSPLLYGEFEAAEDLLARGADEGVRDILYGGTPADWARHARHDRVAQLL